MMITEEHAQWATVHRMRDMLDNVHDDYKVTHTYALFTTILCWVMQRIRTNGEDEADLKARSVLEALEQDVAADAPWKIEHETFSQWKAAAFLIALRNATSHGDARNILPVNKNKILIGHSFRCREYRDGPYVGEIVLVRRDMRRIGAALADRFCDAFSAQPDGSQNVHFIEDAKTIREEAA